MIYTYKVSNEFISDFDTKYKSKETRQIEKFVKDAFRVLF